MSDCKNHPNIGQDCNCSTVAFEKAMTNKEPEKLAHMEFMKDGNHPEFGLFFGDILLDRYAEPYVCRVDIDKINTAAESFAQRRVDDAVKKAVVNERTRCAAVIVGLRCRLLGRVSEDEMFTVEHSQKEIERGGGS